MKRNQEILITLPNSDCEARVTFNFYEGCRARWYLDNGDPGYPAEPAEADIISVKVDGKDIELTDEQMEKLSDAVCEEYSEQLADQARDYDDSND